jgi:hypothetical protein
MNGSTRCIMADNRAPTLTGGERLSAAIPGSGRNLDTGHPAATLPMSDDMDLPDYACLLRDAARASAATWAEPMDQPGHDRAVRHLGIALRDIRVLVARYCLSSLTRPEPARTARAAAVLASTLALGEAWLILEDVLPPEAELACSACVPGDLLCFAARRIAAWRMPTTGMREVMLPVADALAALGDGTAHLAAGAAEPLAGCLAAVQACLEMAAGQLRNAVPVSCA